MRRNVILIALAAAVMLTRPAATATSTAAVTTPMWGTMTGHPATYKHVIVNMMGTTRTPS